MARAVKAGSARRTDKVFRLVITPNILHAIRASVKIDFPRECGETHPATVPHKGVVAFVILNGVKDLARHNESQGFLWYFRDASQA